MIAPSIATLRNCRYLLPYFWRRRSNKREISHSSFEQHSRRFWTTIKRCLLSIEVNQVMFSAHHLSPDQIKPLGRQNIGVFFRLWINIALQRSLRASLGHSTKLNCRTFDSFKIGPLVIWNCKTCNKPKVWYLETKSFHHFDSYKSIHFYNYSRPKVFKSIHVPILQVNQSNEKSELPERFFNPVIKPVRG